MKNIAFIRDGDFPKISESFIVNKLIYLNKYGKNINTLIICKNINNTPETKKYLEKLKENNIKIYAIKNKLSDSNSITYKKFILKKFNILNFSHNIKTLFWKLIREIIKLIKQRIEKKGVIYKIYQNIKNKKEINKIKRIIKKEKINVVNFVYGKDIKKTYKIKNKKLKIITSFHGFDITQIESDKKLLKICKQFSNLILVRSEYMEKKLTNLKIKSNKIKIQRAGCHIENQTTKIKKKNNPYKIISVGRLIEKKGFNILIQAGKILKEKKIKFIINIYGDGKLKEELNQQIKNLNLNKEIKLKGNIDNQKIKKEIINSDLFVLASNTAPNGDEEGIPVVLMESMGLGTVCISTYHAGIPELIENNKTGFLVKQKDPKVLAEKIIETKNNKNLNKIIQNAKEKINKEFTYKAIVKTYEKYLKEI